MIRYVVPSLLYNLKQKLMTNIDVTDYFTGDNEIRE